MDDPFPEGMLDCIKWFLADDAKRLPGLDLYQEVFDTDLFFPLQRQAELAAMIRIAREIKPKTVMEIGADKGGGVYHWCKCLPSVTHMIVNEIRGVPYRDLFQDAFPHVYFYWSGVSSRTPSVIEHLRNNAPPIDILFIDGDKTAFLEDFDAYLPLMNPKGIVFMHDIQDRYPGGPQQASYKVRRRGYPGFSIIDLSDTQAALDRAAKGIPPKSPHEQWLRHWRGKSCGVEVIYLDKTKTFID